MIGSPARSPFLFHAARVEQVNWAATDIRVPIPTSGVTWLVYLWISYHPSANHSRLRHADSHWVRDLRRLQRPRLHPRFTQRPSSSKSRNWPASSRKPENHAG